MSLDESDSTSNNSTLVAYRDQVEQWIRAQHKLALNQPIPAELQSKYMINALRDCCAGHENEENEQQELRRAVDDFQKIVLAKLSGTNNKEDMILAPCRKTDKHTQPCLCPFLWFAVRRYPNGFGGANANRLEEVLSDGES